MSLKFESIKERFSMLTTKGTNRGVLVFKKLLHQNNYNTLLLYCHKELNLYRLNSKTDNLEYLNYNIVILSREETSNLFRT